MKTIVNIVLFLFTLGISAQHQTEDRLIVYMAPAGVELNDNFVVRVRTVNSEWKTIPVYKVSVTRADTKEKTYDITFSSMTYFDFSGTCEVEVTAKGLIETAKIRPLSKHINASVAGKKMVFTLKNPSNLSVEINNDIFNNLQLFANPIDSFKRSNKDKKQLYFGPGLHEIPGGVLQVKSGQTVYIHGSAVIKGCIKIVDAKNVKILGSGMILQSMREGISIANSNDVEISGVFAHHCIIGGSSNVTVKNVKIISYGPWGDGINILSSKNILMDGVFIRSSDDCTTVYGTRGGYKGNASNIVMQNATLWADVAHPIFIGTHGSTENPDILEDIHYRNIDILDHNESQIAYQGCMSINAGDSNLIRNVSFEDIRIEDFRLGQLLNVRVFYNKKYCTSPGRGVQDILFKNVTYTGKNAELSIIDGYDGGRMVKNVVFENLNINGNVIFDDMPEKPRWFNTGDMARIYIGDHVEGVMFRK